MSILSFTIFFSQHALAYKCWTNNEGIKECGDRLPPEYAQKGHQEIGKHGLVTEEADRAKTDEELEADKLEAKRRAEEQKELEAKKLRDKVLLDTYSNVDDMEAIREERIAAIDSSISLSKQQSEKLQTDLDTRMAAMAEKERKGKTPSEAEVNDIEELKRQIDNKKAFITKKQEEKTETNDKFASDIERFKKLKGID